MLLSFHIVAIAALVLVVGNIAYQMGKKEGIRRTRNYYEEPQDDEIDVETTTASTSVEKNGS